MPSLENILSKSEPVIDKFSLDRGVDLIASKIHGRVPDESTIGVIGILTGGLPFMIDLSRKLLNKYNHDVINQMIHISLYGKSRAIDTMQIERDLEKGTLFSYIKNIDSFNLDNIVKYCRAIVIVDDICDSGATILITKKIVEKLLKEYYNVELPIFTASVINVTPANPVKFLEPDFYIKEGNPADWYFGYGMDLEKGKFRMLDEIRKVER